MKRLRRGKTTTYTANVPDTAYVATQSPNVVTVALSLINFDEA